MTTSSTDSAFRRFVSYIDKSREFYAAHGYDRAYRWARPTDRPAFTPLPGPLAAQRVGIITTAFPVPDSDQPAPPEVPYARVIDWGERPGSDPLPGIRFTADDNRDKSAAEANERESFLPLLRFRELVEAGRAASLSPRFYGLPYDYSQRRTVEQDAPAILEYLRDDQVDVAVLIPHCPVCHQSAALVARHLEANGIPTVVIGSARDIVEEIGVPRFLFVDFPLGYPCGRPGDADQQRDICSQALDLLEHAGAPRTTVHGDAEWGDDTWRVEYMRVDDTNRDSLAAAGAARRDEQQRAQAEGRARDT